MSYRTGRSLYELRRLWVRSTAGVSAFVSLSWIPNFSQCFLTASTYLGSSPLTMFSQQLLSNSHRPASREWFWLQRCKSGLSYTVPLGCRPRFWKCAEPDTCEVPESGVETCHTNSPRRPTTGTRDPCRQEKDVPCSLSCRCCCCCSPPPPAVGWRRGPFP